LGEETLERCPERGFDGLLDFREWRGRKVVLQLREILRRLLADQVGTGRQRLAKLDGRRADRNQRGGVVRRGWDSSPKSSDPRQPSKRRGRQRVLFDAAQ